MKTAEELKKEIRIANKKMWSARNSEDQMNVFNAMLEGYGTEVIRGNTWDNFYLDIVAVYVNMGDTYNETILYDVNKHKYYLTTWGDWVEMNQKKYDIQ